MKPGDHPEFFRFPAPEGRSRESTIVLDAQGRFFHDGARVQHAAMEQAFFQWIDRHPDDGRFILQNGYDWTYFQVEDTPYFVLSVTTHPRDAPELLLSDLSCEPLDPSTLQLGDADVLYCRVKDGRFEARFTPQTQNALMPYLKEREDGAIGFELGGTTFEIGPR